MAEFDPRIISEVADYAPNPMRAMQSGIGMSDLLNRELAGRLKVQADQQAYQDEQAARDALKGVDLTTSEGRATAAATLTKINPELGIKFMKSSSELESGALERQGKLLDTLDKKNEISAGLLTPLYAQVQQMRQQGKSDAEIEAALIPGVSSALGNLSQLKLQDGSPAFTPQEIDMIKGQAQTGNLAAMIESMAAKTQEGRALIQAHRAQISKPVKTTGMVNGQPWQGFMTPDGRFQPVVQAPPSAKGAAEKPALEQSGLDLAAESYLKTGNLPRGDAMRSQVLNRAAEMLRQRGDTNGAALAQVESNKSTAKAQGKMIQALTFTETALKTLDRHMGIAVDLGNQLDRTRFPVVNSLDVAINTKAIQDPAAKAYAVALTEAGLEYAKILSGGVQSVAQITEGAREQAKELMSTIDSPEAINAIYEVMKTAGRYKAEEMRNTISQQQRFLENPTTGAGTYPPSQESPPPPATGTSPSPGQPAAGGAPAMKNAQGWALHVDANGNRAYVSPDGKQFEEVR